MLLASNVMLDTRRTRLARYGAMAALTLCAACSGSESGTAPEEQDQNPSTVAAALSVETGDLQSVEAGMELPTMPSVRVRDHHGNGVAGVTVKFTPLPGSGTVTSPTATTDTDGVARVGWTLDTTSGSQFLSVAAVGVATPLTSTFTATARAGWPTGITKISGDNQTAVAGQRLSAPLAVRIVDKFGNPVRNFVVFFWDMERWVVNESGQVVRRPYMAASEPSDENGVAVRPFVTVDTAAGRQIITAGPGEDWARNNVAPPQPINPPRVTFTVTATPRP